MQRRVVLGVTGSIAAYRACDIVSGLVKQGIDVRVILTRAGAEIIRPLALETLSGNPVVWDMFDRRASWEVEHITLAKSADLFLIAPATANIIGKLAAGIADDMLSTTAMATRAPMLIAPAMNSNMYLSDAVQRNMEILRDRGCRFITPATGRLACGDVGVGKLAPVEDIIAEVTRLLSVRRDLEGMRLLVTAGPTCEAIDPVRYITNRSSGKMGYAVAQAAVERGARVTLISGPVSIPAPAGAELVNITSSQELYEAVNQRFEECDALVMAAAPADFTPAAYQAQKIKKSGDAMTLELKATRDILKSLAPPKGGRVVMGFAAETENLEQNALKKLEGKNLDFIAANDVSRPDAGFGVDTNAVTLYRRDGGAEHSGVMSKLEVAHWLLDRLAERRK